MDENGASETEMEASTQHRGISTAVAAIETSPRWSDSSAQRSEIGPRV